MSENTDIRLTAEAFAKIVIERWEQKIIRLNVVHSGKLVNSFASFVGTQANGNVDFIQFTFEYYGKFVDMGVGRGVKKEEVEFSNRKPKQWYSKVFFSQVLKLKEIMVEKYQQKGVFSILLNIEAFDTEAQKINASHKSGEKSQVDNVTGKKKTSYAEFQRNRKESGW